MSTNKYADIIVDITNENVDKPFTYLIPPELESDISSGTPVIIPFGNSDIKRKGYVIAVTDELRPEAAKYTIKSIDSIAPRRVNMEDEFIELSGWMKERYGCPMITAMATVMPVRQKVRARKGYAFKNESDTVKYKLHDPNEEQRDIINTFIEDFDNGIRQTYLLHGVTGSGKTDAYMHMIRHVLQTGRQVILLIPEISLTYQAIDRFYSVFGNTIAVIHSKLSPGERYEQIKRCMDGDAQIIIGPRSALFAPFKNIGLIVIDEEHDSAYKNETVPRYNTADVAKKRAEMHNASLILSSATPSPDSYLNALSGKYKLLKLDSRAGDAEKPDIEVIDMRTEMKKGNRSIFSERLDKLIRDRLSRHEQIILFINRRGYSNFVSCRSCGNAIRCPHCDVSLTVHSGHILKCHYCGFSSEMPSVCPSCGSPYIAEFGVGTQKLENMTRKMYPEARISRLDTDSASGKKASEEILRKFGRGETDILIGTQMVVKGHDYHNVTLVGIMAADTSLFVSDYTAGQRTYELIAQASGRAGRGSKKGCVVIQTYKPEHYAVVSSAQDDFDMYYTNEMNYRKILKYPPAVHIWTVQMSCKNEAVLLNMSASLADIIRKHAVGTEFQIIGPVEPSVYKVNDYFRKLIYVKHSDYDILLKTKDISEKEFRNNYSSDGISILHDFT